MRRARGNAADAHDAADVFLYRSSIAPLLDVRRRFKADMGVLDAMIGYGTLLLIILVRLRAWVLVIFIELYLKFSIVLVFFIHTVVVHRRVEAIRVWRNWIREDHIVHPYKGFGPDLVPPCSFFAV